jgi:hypothetical protein
MPNWSEILQEIHTLKGSGRGDALDVIRRKYLKQLSAITGRNTIAYYSGFLSSANVEQADITDMDKNGFMSVINKLDRGKGLDLILHTPGGNLAAAESLVDYLRTMFGNNIRAIIPQIAMSAGAMMACSCSGIIMGKQSSIGPIDPQFRGIAASGVIEEFELAKREVAADPKCIPIWQVIIGKYHPTFIGECEKAILWAKEIVTKWLEGNMLACDVDKKEKVENIVNYLSDHNETKSHSRHIGLEDCKRIGLHVFPMETPIDGKDLQDVILSIHHSYMITFSSSPAIKIIENQNGVAMIINKNMPIPQGFPQALQIPFPIPPSIPTSAPNN